jgi:hypothetical protein
MICYFFLAVDYFVQTSNTKENQISFEIINTRHQEENDFYVWRRENWKKKQQNILIQIKEQTKNCERESKINKINTKKKHIKEKTNTRLIKKKSCLKWNTKKSFFFEINLFRCGWMIWSMKEKNLKRSFVGSLG